MSTHDEDEGTTVMAADQPRQRTEHSDLVRTRMTALGLSLR